MCRLQLIAAATPLDDEAVVGDECHIVSSQKNGPRHDPSFTADAFDSYDNLLILCKVHHKLVDDQADTYGAELLKLLKNNHEKWVAEKLSHEQDGPAPVRIRRIKKNIPEVLLHVRDGRRLADIVFDAQAYQFGHDELVSEEERDLVAEFLQDAQDWGELSMELEAGQRVRTAFDLSSALRKLDSAGLWVFGASEIQRLEGGIGSPTAFKVAILTVVRKNSPSIIPLSEPETPESGAATERDDDGQSSCAVARGGHGGQNPA
jgi:hypothetical protein